MTVLQDLAAEDIKEPSFDRPEGTDPAELSISNGTRVVLGYHGTQLSAQVTAVERLGSSFIGRVLGATAPDAGHGDPARGDLARGDLVRFRPRDVLWTE